MNGEQYDSVYKTIHVSEQTTLRALIHEFGHHIDNAINIADNKFIKVILKTINNINKDTSLQQTMSKIMSERSAYTNSELSDIFCALVRGNKDKEHLWGIAGHGADDYKNDVIVRTEIFANLFSIYARNDKEAIKILGNISPDIIKTFLDITNGAKVMENDKNILEKSAKVESFSTKPWIFKEKPDMRIRDKFDEPCLKYVRERKKDEHTSKNA